MRLVYHPFCYLPDQKVSSFPTPGEALPDALNTLPLFFPLFPDAPSKAKILLHVGYVVSASLCSFSRCWLTASASILRASPSSEGRWSFESGIACPALQRTALQSPALAHMHSLRGAQGARSRAFHASVLGSGSLSFSLWAGVLDFYQTHARTMFGVLVSCPVWPST